MVSPLNDLDESVRTVIHSLLEVWRAIAAQINEMNVTIARAAKSNEACRRMMTIPGVGPITAIAYASTVDRPGRFRRAKDLGPYLGLIPRRYQSGDVDWGGRISKCGDRLTRSLLFEAAGVLLFRTRRSSAIQRWGLAIVRRSGYAKARLAVARKLAVVMHQIWTDETEFCWRAA